MHQPRCPAIDPLPPPPVSFTPYGSYAANWQTLVFSGCTATGLQVTIGFFGSGARRVLRIGVAGIPVLGIPVLAPRLPPVPLPLPTIKPS